MLSPGCTVGNLKIGKLLGRGAMGEVYSGEQVTLRRAVAIKRIASHLADDADIIQRFAREAQCVAKINSPNVVGVYEFGQFTDEQKDSHYLLIMELVEGGHSLKGCIGTEITWQQASSVIMQVADGLTAASEHDVIHRDIKPDNIMLSKKGVAKLADFGLAKSVDSTAMTMEGTLMGTPNYMPPEACRGENVDARGDIYSLGATWYHLITGMPLFSAANTMALLRAHCEEAPKPIQEVVPNVPDNVASFIMSCVAKNKEDRPANADAIYKFLQSVPGVPRTAPELIRIADAAKARNDNSGSTIATMVAAGSNDAATLMGGAADAVAETIVTGAHQNQQSSAPKNSQSATATAITASANTLMSEPAVIGEAKTSKLPMIMVMLLVFGGLGAAVVAGAYAVMSLTQEKKDPVLGHVDTGNPQPDKAIDDGNPAVTVVVPAVPDKATTTAPEAPVDPVNTEPKTTAQVTTPEASPDTAALETQRLTEEVTALIAAKEFSKAKLSFDKMRELSPVVAGQVGQVNEGQTLASSADELAKKQRYEKLAEQIKVGQAAQKALAEELSSLDKNGHFAALAKKLDDAKGYPELGDVYGKLTKRCADFEAGLSIKLSSAQIQADKKQWTEAQKLLTQIGVDERIVSPQAMSKLELFAPQVAEQLAAQTKLAIGLADLKKRGHAAALQTELAKAEAFPELSAQVSEYKKYADEFAKKSVATYAAAETAHGQKQWKIATEQLKNLGADELVIGKELAEKSAALLLAVQKASGDQSAVAQSLAALHAKGLFVDLEQALTTADAFPDLKPVQAQYQKDIASNAQKVKDHIAAAQRDMKNNEYIAAQKQLDAVGEDAHAVPADLIKQSQALRQQLTEQGAAAVEDAIQTAIAGVEEGTTAGLGKSRNALKGAVGAAQVSGMEDKLNSVMLKLAEIIEKRSE